MIVCLQLVTSSTSDAFGACEYALHSQLSQRHSSEPDVF